ncbi:MAG TPA: PhaM family polyhydroxyalkanoate granule multifunctional regulatory protein [Burkholderiales bacterium]|nr:PhaM family polyhydroxyalkanoate granule multifunctional regulatory protein [Burkholderiales bacterium]
MFRRLWGPLGLPVPGMAMPTLDPQEVEKRIAELRSVEGWLTLNLNMVRFSIQGLELQKSALNAMQGGAQGAAQAPAGADAQGPSNPMLWPWAMMQQAMTEPKAESKDEPKDESRE